ncbi:MAG: hypothetical protein NWR96_07960 [Crocinitomicaceae bacterium]|jgi:hypothetical protein|nr:hypothetical protein [Crocinitomicaceae bacterium]MDP4761553.1 hypothetical protein [Crocinitomicaceae bacterium]
MIKPQKLLLATLLIFAQSNFFAQEVNADLVTIACGNNYFSNTGTSQPPLIVSGWWCGDSYMWTPVSIGDTLRELGYVDDALYTGKAISYDSLGNMLAWYTFDEGYLQHIEEFIGKDTLRNSLNLKNGIPHGTQRNYDWDGQLWMEKTFEDGILNGPFFWRQDRRDFGLDPCIETGIFRNGVYERTSEPCEVGDN